MHWGALLAFQELTKKLQEIIDFIEHYLSFQSVLLQWILSRGEQSHFQPSYPTNDQNCPASIKYSD